MFKIKGFPSIFVAYALSWFHPTAARAITFPGTTPPGGNFQAVRFKSCVDETQKMTSPGLPPSPVARTRLAADTFVASPRHLVAPPPSPQFAGDPRVRGSQGPTLADKQPKFGDEVAQALNPFFVQVRQGFSPPSPPGLPLDLALSKEFYGLMKYNSSPRGLPDLSREQIPSSDLLRSSVYSYLSFASHVPSLPEGVAPNDAQLGRGLYDFAGFMSTGLPMLPPGQAPDQAQVRQALYNLAVFQSNANFSLAPRVPGQPVSDDQLKQALYHMIRYSSATLPDSPLGAVPSQEQLKKALITMMRDYNWDPGLAKAAVATMGYLLLFPEN